VTTEADSLAAAVEAPYDYIGVKASAGGAPLAANLADAGMRVLPDLSDVPRQLVIRKQDSIRERV
jgi:protein-L-isoaspartate O-methyltransferase